MDILLDHIDFIAICEIGNPSDFGWGLRVDKLGVWGIEPDRPEIISKEALLNVRPPRGYNKPILSLPCRKEELRNFLEWACMEEYLEDLDTYVARLEEDYFDPSPQGYPPTAINRETPERYIERRRGQGEIDEVIAVELVNRPGDFMLKYREIAILFSLDKGLPKDKYAATKEQGYRFCKRGRKILEERERASS